MAGCRDSRWWCWRCRGWRPARGSDKEGKGVPMSPMMAYHDLLYCAGRQERAQGVWGCFQTKGEALVDSDGEDAVSEEDGGRKMEM